MKRIRENELEKRISAIEGQLNSGKEERDLFQATWRTVLKRFADDFQINISDLDALKTDFKQKESPQ